MSKGTALCVDCHSECSRGSSRCKSCAAHKRWTDPSDARRIRFQERAASALTDRTCECGCGGTPDIAKVTRRGYRKGDRMRFIHGHNRRKYHSPVASARCARCRAELDASEFYTDPSRPTGLSSKCKLCCSVANRANHVANRDDRLQIMAEYRAKPGQRERQRELVRRWEQSNPEETRRRKRDRQLTRLARQRAVFDEVVEAWIVYERDRGICGICKEPVHENAFHIDHIIPLALGGRHSYANVQLAHPLCNVAKGARIIL